MLLLPILLLSTTHTLANPILSPRQTTSSSSSTNCTTTGIHMIVARASTEPPGTGSLLAPLISGLESYLPGSDHVAVDYPASLVNYGDSVNVGVTDMTSLIESYVQACPDSKIVLLGYSQGAQVVGDTLCGTSSGGGFVQTGALSQVYDDNVIGAIMMGDPASVAGLPIDQGNATGNGMFPRTDVSGCAQYGSKVRSYCDDGDVYCDSGMFMAPHWTYMELYAWDAGYFICDLAAAAGLPACQ